MPNAPIASKTNCLIMISLCKVNYEELEKQVETKRLELKHKLKCDVHSFIIKFYHPSPPHFHCFTKLAYYRNNWVIKLLTQSLYLYKNKKLITKWQSITHKKKYIPIKNFINFFFYISPQSSANLQLLWYQKLFQARVCILIMHTFNTSFLKLILLCVQSLWCIGSNLIKKFHGLLGLFNYDIVMTAT